MWMSFQAKRLGGGGQPFDDSDCERPSREVSLVRANARGNGCFNNVLVSSTFGQVLPDNENNFTVGRCDFAHRSVGLRLHVRTSTLVSSRS